MCVVLLCLPGSVYARAPVIVDRLAHDIGATFGGWPMFVILGGGIAAGELAPLDGRIANHFVNHPRLGTLDTIANTLGAPYVIDTAALVTYGVGRLTHQPTIALTGETLTEALMLTESATLGLKILARRTRPDGGNYGFPSGHAARTFAIAGALEALHGPAIGVPAFLLAGAVSVSRIDRNVHYLSDLLFGAAWGAAIGWGTARAHRQPHTDRLTMTPGCMGQPGLSLAYRF